MLFLYHISSCQVKVLLCSKVHFLLSNSMKISTLPFFLFCYSLPWVYFFSLSSVHHCNSKEWHMPILRTTTRNIGRKQLLHKITHKNMTTGIGMHEIYTCGSLTGKNLLNRHLPLCNSHNVVWYSGHLQKLFFFKCSNLHWRTLVLVMGLHFLLAFDHLIKLSSKIFHGRNVSNKCAPKDITIYY